MGSARRWRVVFGGAPKISVVARVWLGVPPLGGPKPRQRGTPNPQRIQIEPLRKLRSPLFFSETPESECDESWTRRPNSHAGRVRSRFNFGLRFKETINQSQTQNSGYVRLRAQLAIARVQTRPAIILLALGNQPAEFAGLLLALSSSQLP